MLKPGLLKISLLFILVLLLTSAETPLDFTCIHRDLSKEFNFRIRLRKYSFTDSRDSSIVTCQIIEKATNKTRQTIRFWSNFIYGEDYEDCNTARSYSTGKNKEAEAPDNNYGSMIIADLNFDSREDIALESDLSAGSGPSYRYYLQTKDGRFREDKYLSNKVVFFPSEINKQQRTLTTTVVANMIELGITTFELDSATNKWKIIKHTYVRPH